MAKKQTSSQPRIYEKCLLCHTVETEDSRLRRGLCIKHYEQFRRSLAMIPADKQAAYEEFLVSKKELLPKRQGQKGGDTSHFSERAKEFLSPELREIAQDGIDQVYKPKRKGKE